MNNELSPYITIDKSSWAALKKNLILNLSAEEITRYCSINDSISLKEVSDVYLPLSRLLNLYFRTRELRGKVIDQFTGHPNPRAPFIISIAGSVAVGKSTTARILQAILSDWKSKPRVALVTTDGFLYPNETLIKRNIMNRKGFPISYDMQHLIKFVSDVKSGIPRLEVPVYSHMTYDIVPNAKSIIDRPDILIIEGLNVLQSGMDYPDTPHHVFLSDYVDSSIYVDAEPEVLKEWYIQRFLTLRINAFNDPNCFFHKYAKITEEEAIAIASSTWDIINYTNLVENILPTRERASLILKKNKNHEVSNVKLRK